MCSIPWDERLPREKLARMIPERLTGGREGSIQNGFFKRKWKSERKNGSGREITLQRSFCLGNSITSCVVTGFEHLAPLDPHPLPLSPATNRRDLRPERETGVIPSPSPIIGERGIEGVRACCTTLDI